MFQWLYLCLNKGYTEAMWIAVVGVFVVADGRTQVNTGCSPGAAPIVSSRIIRTLGRCPLKHIAMHIIKAPGVGWVATHIGGLVGISSCIRITIPIVVGIACSNRVSKRVCRCRAGTAGILPLLFCR